jgi:Arc/MetJ-type ribon-helix-helix transcriptional regulator
MVCALTRSLSRITVLQLGNTMPIPMRTVSFKLPQKLDEALDELARKRNATRSELVREAIEALAKGKRRSVTAAVEARTLGVDGPADLSSNPKHLAGYGK